MAKRFSVIDLVKEQLVLPGFKEPDNLADIDEVAKLLEYTPEFEEVQITILHLLLIDEIDVEEDATEEKVELIKDRLPELMDENSLDFVESIIISPQGLQDNNGIIDTMD